MATATSARTAKRQPAPLPNALEIIEQYAANHDLALQSDDFLALVSRLSSQWGTEHERQIALLIANSCDVCDAESYARVAEDLRIAAEREKHITIFFEPRKNVVFRAHRLICDRENVVLNPLREWVRKAKASWDGYRREEERKRREEEQRLSEEARRQEQERLEREARLLEQRGETKLAEQVLEQAIATPAPVITVQSSLPSVRGVSSREAWTWRPIGGDTDGNRARAVQLVPREFLMLDEKKLNAYARMHKSSARVPGIEFYDAGSVSVRL